MEDNKPRVSKQTFPHYLKLGLALQITRDGLRGMVEDEATVFHQSILQEIQNMQPCSNCYIENILECPTEGYCTEKHCPFHNNRLKQPRPCPDKTCNIFRDRIRKTHRTKPSWRNTDARRWGTDPFQICKCYLPSSGYDDINSLADTDLNGFLHLIINNRHFEEKMSETISEVGSVYAKAIDIGQIYHHSNSLSISDMELHSYVNILTELLMNSKVLLYDQRAKESVAKLAQLKADILTISTYEVKNVLDEAIASIHKDSKYKEQSNQRKAEKNKTTHDISIDNLRLKILKDCRRLFCDGARKIKSKQLEAVVSGQTLSINDLKKETMKLKAALEKVMLEEQTSSPFRKTTTNVKEESQVAADKPVSLGRRLLSRSSASEDESYQELMSELRMDLVWFYRERHSTLPLSPLIQKNKAPLLDFYVPPTLKVVDLDKGLLDGKEYPMYKDVNVLTEIFVKNEMLCKSICLTSQPGTGKTSFLKYLSLLWCQAHSPATDTAMQFSTTDLAFIRNYAFLFLIPLRDARQECEQDVMIKNLLISQLDQEYAYTYDFLEAVLHEETCLVLMDGLDEWRHPKPSLRLCRLGKSDFPHTKVRPKCTTLSTTRPWTLSKFRKCNTNIDQHLEMQGLGKDSSEKLICNVIAYLNSKNKSKKKLSAEDFLTLLSSKGLLKFESNPVILMQLLCLWYEGTDPGESQCEIYSNMLELLFRRADYSDKKSIKGKQQTKLPTCFKKNPMCKRNARLLFSLGKLAFATLFPGRRQSAFVFDRSVAVEYLDDHDIQRCLEAGILSHSEEQGKIGTEKLNLTFLHNTFQEFFAALSIISKAVLKKDEEKKMFENLNSVQDILQLETILIFVSGFSPKMTSVLTKRTQEITEQDCITKQYRTNIGTLFLESRVCMIDYCYMIAKCVKESISNGHVGLENIHLEDIFIDKKCVDEQYTSALRHLIEMNVKRIKSLSILVKQTIPDESVKYIIEQINVRDICSLEKLYVWGEIPHVLLRSLLQQSRHTIKCIELWGMTLFLEDIATISSTVSLEGLSFLSVTMAHVALEYLMSQITLQTKLHQICLHDIECTDDHNERCPGYELKLSDRAKPSLLLLDKVNLTRIVLEAVNLKWCVVEWLPVPGALKSLLNCLKKAPLLERFDYDGHASLEDTISMCSTVPTFEKLEYLRLRNIDLSTTAVDFSKMINLRRVQLVNVNMECKVMENVIEQIGCIDSTVMVFMDNCEISTPEKYLSIKEQMRLSGKIEVLIDSDRQLYFKTTPTAFASSGQNLHNQTGTSTSLWEQCTSEDETTSRQSAEHLMKIGVVPDQDMLNTLCKKFGKRDKIITTLCQDICSGIRRKNSKILSVWPTYLCSVESGSSENNIVFVVVARETLLSKEIKEIGYTLKERVLGKYSDEGKCIMLDETWNKNLLSIKESENLKRCIKKHAKELMRRHSFLSVITPSHVRSKGFGTELKLQREPCIALYVHTKGYIALDEEPFQKEYDGIPVDVREGNFETHPRTDAKLPSEYHDILKMGCEIGNETDKTTNQKLSGTLGGFIDHPLYGLCGFTCAHVLLHNWGMEELKRLGKIEWPSFHPYETIYQPGGTNHGIGRLVYAQYAEGTDDRSGVEVALFQIESRHPNAGDFPSMQIQAEDDDLRCDSGKVHGCSRINHVAVVKFGCATYRTEGEFVLSEPATTVRTATQEVVVNKCQITLHNQLEVKLKTLRPDMNSDKFADFGDSGSLVFMKGSDGDFQCVGMVEGGTSYGTTIVTPITPILEAFKVTRLKSFETEKLTSELKTIRTNLSNEIHTLKSRVDQLDTNLQSFGNSIMRELQDIKSKMSSPSQQN